MIPIRAVLADIELVLVGLAAADAVRAAMQELPRYAEGELFSLWERDATALIEEHEAAQAADVPVVMPGELTASDVVALRADPEQFARRARRPVPFKPNTYAKRGTAFHEWLEDYYGARPLLTEDELPGNDDAEVDRATLERLKRNFEASEWARRTPEYVEHPFELSLGEAVVRGRMDAVFAEPDGWVVVVGVDDADRRFSRFSRTVSLAIRSVSTTQPVSTTGPTMAAKASAAKRLLMAPPDVGD